MQPREAEVLAQVRARQLLRRAPATARTLRRKAGLTLEEVGAALGVSRVTVYRWESGARVPRGDTAMKYLHFLKRAAGGTEAGARQ